MERKFCAESVFVRSYVNKKFVSFTEAVIENSLSGISRTQFDRKSR